MRLELWSCDIPNHRQLGILNLFIVLACLFCLHTTPPSISINGKRLGMMDFSSSPCPALARAFPGKCIGLTRIRNQYILLVNAHDRQCVILRGLLVQNRK